MATHYAPRIAVARDYKQMRIRHLGGLANYLKIDPFASLQGHNCDQARAEVSNGVSDRSALCGQKMDASLTGPANDIRN